MTYLSAPIQTLTNILSYSLKIQPKAPITVLHPWFPEVTTTQKLYYSHSCFAIFIAGACINIPQEIIGYTFVCLNFCVKIGPLVFVSTVCFIDVIILISVGLVCSLNSCIVFHWMDRSFFHDFSMTLYYREGNIQALGKE